MNRLRELRKLKGLTQKEVALAINVSAQSYGYYENWINKPDPETLIKLADFFEVSVDYLIGRADDFGNVNVITNGAELSAPEKTLLECFDKLNIFERESILIQVKALAKKNESETIKK